MESFEGLALAALHSAAGARFEPRDGPPRLANYGEAPSEYRAMREDAGLVDLHDRGALEVTGATRQKFLHGLLSNEVASLQPGEGRAAALLAPKGGVLALLRVLADPRAVRLETSLGRLNVVMRWLEHHRVAAPVRLAVRPTAILAVLGPRAAGYLEATGARLPPEVTGAHLDTEVAGRPVRLVRAEDLPLPGLVLHLEPADASSVWSALLGAGARPVGRDALDAARIEALRPWYDEDLDETVLLHETGLLGELHSPGKGCYVGQENVARLEGRGGHVSRALRGLRLSAAVPAGAPIRAEGRTVGRLTSSAVSPRLGPIGMGLVHRSQFAPGSILQVETATATVVDRF